MTIDKIAANVMTSFKMTKGKMTLDKIPIDKMTENKMASIKMTRKYNCKQNDKTICLHTRLLQMKNFSQNYL